MRRLSVPLGREERTLELLEQHDIDLVVLARYMQMLTPQLAAGLPEKIINTSGRESHQDVARTSHRDSAAELIRKGRDLERIVLSTAVRAHPEDRILVFD